MKPGPRPKPTNRLNSWPAKARKNEPKPPKARPTCPKSLSAAAKKKFRETVKHLESMNVLTKVDGDVITLYADLWTWLRECRAFLDKHGDCFPTYDGDGNLTGYRQYPAVSLALKLAPQAVRLEAELGLTPSGRTSLKVDPAIAQVSSRSRTSAGKFFEEYFAEVDRN